MELIGSIAILLAGLASVGLAIAFLSLAPVNIFPWRTRRTRNGRRRVLICGAGSLGQQVLVDLVTSPDLSNEFDVVGFVDDDPDKNNKIASWQLLGPRGQVKTGPIRVWGPTKNIEEVIGRLNVDEVVSAVLNPNPQSQMHVQQVCEKLNVEYSDLGETECVTQKLRTRSRQN